jgi:ribonuclease HII
MRERELFPHTFENELRAIASKRGSTLETALRKHGYSKIAGIDEAGRGPLAGPVVACAVVIPLGMRLPKLTDSKLLSSRDRESLYKRLTTSQEVIYSVGIVPHEVIDRINILQASLQAMHQALKGLSTQPDAAIVDGTFVPETFSMPCFAVVKGDRLCRSVSAASVIAKVTRDRIMLEYDTQWPEYGFAMHKGYGTALHLERLQKYGPCPIHRRSVSPVAELSAPTPLMLL